MVSIAGAATGRAQRPIHSLAPSYILQEQLKGSPPSGENKVRYCTCRPDHTRSYYYALAYNCIYHRLSLICQAGEGHQIGHT